MVNEAERNPPIPNPSYFIVAKFYVSLSAAAELGPTKQAQYSLFTLGF